MVTADKTELINRIKSLQMRIAHCMRDDAPDAWLGLNLTIVQLKSLMFIKHRGITNFKMLATALRVSPPNVTGIVERLVEQEFITREENPQNRRMQLLKLTTRGENLLTELHERGDTKLTEILSFLSLEDLSRLAQGLTALAQAAEKRSGIPSSLPL
jgi:DNA-binding MarR family transcriptional regulator